MSEQDNSKEYFGLWSPDRVPGSDSVAPFSGIPAGKATEQQRPDPATPIPVAPVRPPAFSTTPIPPTPSSVPSIEPAPPVSETLLGKILFVAPKDLISPHLLFALRVEKHEPQISHSLADAYKALSESEFKHVFIHKSFRRKGAALRKRIADVAPNATVRFFGENIDLLVNDTVEANFVDLFKKNLHLSRHLHDSDRAELATHAAEVAKLTDALCTEVQVPSETRLALLTAAYLHDIAKADLQSPEDYDHKAIIALSASRLAAWGYPARVVNFLRCMSQDNHRAANAFSGEEILGGCILAAADLYCEMRESSSDLPLDRHHHIKQHLLAQKDQFAVPDVIDQLLKIAGSQIQISSQNTSVMHVHILAPEGTLSETLASDLTKRNLFISKSETVRECAEACKKSQPQALLVRECGDAQALTDLLLGLSLAGVPLQEIPSVLLVREEVVNSASWAFKHGIEDIFPESVTHEALATKLLRIQKRREQQSQSRIDALQNLGAHGSLSDMNFPSVLETTRNRPAPALLSVTAQAKQLMVYVENNTVRFASCEGVNGIDALAEAMSWKNGIWNIDPIDPEEIPEANLNQSIDSVLLDICVRFDEQAADSTN